MYQGIKNYKRMTSLCVLHKYRSVLALKVTNGVSIFSEAVQARVTVNLHLCAPVPQKSTSFSRTSTVVPDGISKHIEVSSILIIRFLSNLCWICKALRSSKHLLSLSSNWDGNFCCTDLCRLFTRECLVWNCVSHPVDGFNDGWLGLINLMAFCLIWALWTGKCRLRISSTHW